MKETELRHNALKEASLILEMKANSIVGESGYDLIHSYAGALKRMEYEYYLALRRVQGIDKDYNF